MLFVAEEFCLPCRARSKVAGRPFSRPIPYLPVRLEADFEHVADDEEYLAQLGRPPTEYLPDESQSIVAENDSPDIGFRYSVNPYRGCSHGCSYCYARPYHEYLGLSAGLDFETKVFVKYRAAELLRDFLARPAWRPETIVFSGVTDCYQPAEREFRITRALRGGRGRVPPADRHHHEERARDARHRSAASSWPSTTPSACRSRSRRSTRSWPA